MSDLKLTPQVLAMYLGCEIEAKGSRGILRNVNLKGFCTLQLSEEIGQSIGCLVEEVKPILRRLSSMTEEEAREFCVYCPSDWKVVVTPDQHGIYIKCWKVGDLESMQIVDLEAVTASQFQYLLSKHFDLFGLIDAGLAIEKP